jgi:hypothetical protein
VILRQSDSTEIILNGNITGVILLYDENRNQILDASGVIITLEGTLLTTVTSKNGSWLIKNVPAGIYNIKFTKDGFPTVMYYNIQFVGGGTLAINEQRLGHLPSINVTSLRTISSSSMNRIIAKGSVSSTSTTSHNIFIFFTRRPIHMSTNMLFDYAMDGYVDKDSLNFKTYAIMNPSEKFKYGFKSGEKLYAVAFTTPYHWYRYSTYNPVTKKYEINPDEFNFSNIDSVTVP